MPIHLPPLSRRRFLGGSLTAGVALLLDHSLPAVERESAPHEWVLVSDLHVAADRGKIFRGVNMAEAFQTAAREIQDLPRMPAAVLINGDLAFSAGEPGDYEAVLGILRPVREAGVPIHLTLGNHDERGHFWETFADARNSPRPVPEHQVALVHAARANWFILDSLEKANSTPGLLGEAQLAWLARTLDEHRDQPALVLCHHNLDPVKALKDSAQLLEIIRPRKQVKAYIFGHTHDWNIQRDTSGIHLVNLPPTAYTFVEGKPRGWVHATLRDDGIRLELHCLDRTHPAHGEVVNLDWRES